MPTMPETVAATPPQTTGRLVVSGIGATVALQISGSNPQDTTAALEQMWSRCLTADDRPPADTVTVSPQPELLHTRT